MTIKPLRNFGGSGTCRQGASVACFCSYGTRIVKPYIAMSDTMCHVDSVAHSRFDGWR